MIHTNVDLLPITAIRVVPEVPGYLSVYFVRPRGFTFEAGDWIELRHPLERLPGGKVYSLASSPLEPELRITFREGITPFKKLLAGLQPGDRLMLFQYGNDYGFRLSEHKASVLIAGGVGVTPFRSMISEVVDQGSSTAVQLVYLNTNENFLYQDEFESWQRQSPVLRINLVATKDLKRKDREKLLTNLIPAQEQRYYVSGPSGMVTSTLRFLDRLGVAKQDIRVDDFGDL